MFGWLCMLYTYYYPFITLHSQILSSLCLFPYINTTTVNPFRSQSVGHPKIALGNIRIFFLMPSSSVSFFISMTGNEIKILSFLTLSTRTAISESSQCQNLSKYEFIKFATATLRIDKIISRNLN